MDPVALPGLKPWVYPHDSTSLGSLPAEGLSETQQVEEVWSTARAGENLSSYTFPRQRLNQVQNDSSRDPLVLVACGQSLNGHVLPWFCVF